MARNVYSQRFFSHSALAPGTYTQLVPDGLVYVLRDVDVVPVGSFPADMGFTGDAGQFIAYWDLSAAPAGAEGLTWRGRQVISATEPWGVVVFHGSWDVTISGYALTLP